MKAELKKAGIAYGGLVQKLAELGIEETVGSVTVKINRGVYPAWWLFAVMKAIGRQHVRIDDV